MRRLLTLVLAGVVLAGSAPVAFAEPGQKVIEVQTHIEFSLDPATIDPNTGQYRAEWSGTVSGDIDGTIRGVQTGVIIPNDPSTGIISFQDTWTIEGKNGAVLQGADSGTSTYSLPASPAGVGATYTTTESVILSGNKNFKKYAGCRGAETGDYILNDPTFLFAGTMKGTLTLHCTPGNSPGGDDTDKNDKDADEEKGDDKD